MKVLIIYKGPYPNGNVTTQRVHYLCKGLQENGALVELLIPVRTESESNILNYARDGNYDGIKFHYIPTTTIRNKNIIIRFFQSLFSQTKTIFAVALNKSKSNINLIIGPSFDFRLLLPLVTKLTRAKSVLEINEYPFVNQKNWLIKNFKKLVFLKIVVPNYSGFIVISENLRHLISKYKSKTAEIIKIPIIGAPEKKYVASKSPVDNPYIIHAGSWLESKDGLSGIVTAFAYAVRKLNRPLKLVITGKSNNNIGYSNLKHLIEHLEIEKKVIFTGYLSRPELINYLQNSSLAIINKDQNQQNQYCFATKITDYLFNSIPLIITNIGETKYYFKDGLNSIIIEPGDTNLLAEKIIEAINKPDLMKKISEEGYKLAMKEFYYKPHCSKLYDFFTNCLG